VTISDNTETETPKPTKDYDYLLGALDAAILITAKMEEIFRERSK
jgi:hypothetical protein